MATAVEAPPKFSIASVLGKRPDDPKLEDVFTMDKQLGKGSFGVVHLGRGAPQRRRRQLPRRRAAHAAREQLCAPWGVGWGGGRQGQAIAIHHPPLPLAAQAVNKTTGKPAAVKSISKAKLVCKEDVEDVKGEVAILHLVGGHKHVVSLEVRREPCMGLLHGAVAWRLDGARRRCRNLNASALSLGSAFAAHRCMRRGLPPG